MHGVISSTTCLTKTFNHLFVQFHQNTVGSAIKESSPVLSCVLCVTRSFCWPLGLATSRKLNSKRFHINKCLFKYYKWNEHKGWLHPPFRRLRTCVFGSGTYIGESVAYMKESRAQRNTMKKTQRADKYGWLDMVVCEQTNEQKKE